MSNDDQSRTATDREQGAITQRTARTTRSLRAIVRPPFTMHVAFSYIDCVIYSLASFRRKSPTLPILWRFCCSCCRGRTLWTFDLWHRGILSFLIGKKDRSMVVAEGQSSFVAIDFGAHNENVLRMSGQLQIEWIEDVLATRAKIDVNERLLTFCHRHSLLFFAKQETLIRVTVLACTLVAMVNNYIGNSIHPYAAVYMQRHQSMAPIK